MEAENRLRTVSATVDERLAKLLPDPENPPQSLHQAMRYSCLAPGKRLRPALCVASAEAVGGDPEAVLDAACAFEMVHAFSLIHDDLPAIDNDDLRRGQLSCHKKFGEAIAILAGDALFALAYETLAGSLHEPKVVAQSLRILSKAVGSDGLVGGEVVDVESEGKPVSPSLLEFIHTRKTGALMAAACEIGGLLGGGSDELAGLLGAFGQKVGLAFQITDDLLNELSTPEMLGKSVGSDRRRRKATFPALYGIEASHAAARKMVSEAIGLLARLPNHDGLEELALFSIERLS